MSNRTRLWTLFTGVICVLLILFGVLGGLLPRFAEASGIHGLAENQRNLNEIQQARIDTLEPQQANIRELEAQLGELETAIPSSLNTAGLLRDLEAFQASSGAQIDSISISTPTAAAAPADASQSAGATGAETTGADAAAGAGAATTPPATDTSTAAPASGIYEASVTLSATGTLAQVRDFVRSVQLNPRLTFVNRAEITGSGELFTTNIEATIYALPS